MHRIKVENVEVAVQVAKQLIRPDRTFWFRGQAKDWPIRTSFMRIKKMDHEIVMDKIARFESWVKNTAGLENLATNTDATIGVAQHYGLPTNFVDFTIKPEIAGYFASENAGPETAEEMGCIIILNIQDIKEFWKNLPERYPIPEFLEMEIPDLWRLEAQYGRFLFCPYENIEMIYHFDRIYFPNTHQLPGITKGEIYPERKSHLEILLDQYFMNERMIEAERRLKPENFTCIFFPKSKGGCDPDVFPKGLPEHPSWNIDTLRPWLELYAEPLKKVLTPVNFQILIPNSQDMSLIINEIAGQLLNELFGHVGIRNKLLGWHIQVRGNFSLPQDFESRLAVKLSRLWDGLRRLPYSDKDLSYGIGQCVAFAISLAGDFQNPDHRNKKEAVLKCLSNPIELEFGADDGSYSRGYVSETSLANAIRPDILTHIADEWKDQLSNNTVGILQTAWTPKQTFNFGLLTPMFAREIAPYQVLVRETAIFYSPARLVSLGRP